MPNKAHHELNRLSWNEGTKAHNSHKGDQAQFFRGGGNIPFLEEEISRRRPKEIGESFD